MLTLDKKARDYIIWMFGKKNGALAIKDIELKAHQQVDPQWKFFSIDIQGIELFFTKKDFDSSEESMNYDPVNHPKHYVEQSATIEPIEVLRFAPFDLGNALKYMIRAGHKDNELQDLKKAEWYLECAEQTWETHNEIYDEFFRRYGRILTQFKGIPIELYMMDASPLSVLIGDVRHRIKLIEK